MNIILAEAAEVVDRQLMLTDYRAEHIVKVLRSEIGDRLRVGLINGLRGYGTILAQRKKFPFSVVLDLDLSDPPGDLPPLDLILASTPADYVETGAQSGHCSGRWDHTSHQRQPGGKELLGVGSAAAS